MYRKSGAQSKDCAKHRKNEAHRHVCNVRTLLVCNVLKRLTCTERRSRKEKAIWPPKVKVESWRGLITCYRLLLRPTDPCHCHILTSCTNSYTATNLSSSIKIIPSHHERHRSLFSHVTGPTAGSPLNSSRRRGNTPHLQSITVSTFGGIGTCPCSSSSSLLATLQRLPV